MNLEIIERIFQRYGLEDVESIKKIEIGFTNEVYSVNNRFILKICEDSRNEHNFAREVFFYDFFKGKIPVPEVEVYDNSRELYHKFFMIYPQIEGVNLYATWHLLDDYQRRKLIKQLCQMLRIINQAPYQRFQERFELSSELNWHDKMLRRISKCLIEIEDRKILSRKFIQAIRDFIQTNHSALKEQRIALVYWDAHFDNILVTGDQIVGILDFERTELASIDFVLDIIQRMSDYPRKYMSAEMEQYAKKEDYARLLDWFQEFYPELFHFKDLDRRLDFYSIEHDLQDLLIWSDSQGLKQMIAKRINFSNSPPELLGLEEI